MTGETVLIAAFSGRALAASARRAGYLPLVVDCFGDEDLQIAAEASICLPARIQVGFRAKPLIDALEFLDSGTAAASCGLVLGSGFECDARLMARLAQRFRLLGNSPQTVARTKDPNEFFPMLSRLGIRHPATQTEPPATAHDWLMKRVGGSGGLHIVPCPRSPRPDRRRYFQRRHHGVAISVLGIAGQESATFGVSRQWCAPLKRRPYRYGGAVGAITIEPAIETQLVQASRAIAQELGLIGLVSFDYLVSEGKILCLEVNPRPGASLDIFDDADGRLFEAHIRACSGEDPANFSAKHRDSPRVKAAAVLYADRGAVDIEQISWPEWVRDRPVAGSAIGRGQPLATVVAAGATAQEAEQMCKQRLGAVAEMLYEGRTREEQAI